MVNPLDLGNTERKCLLAAGDDILESYRVLRNTDDNVVGEVLRGQGTFYEWNHYPPGDVFDRNSGSQYFYHAHPTDLRGGEHGHFHTFLRRAGMPAGVKPVTYNGSAEWPQGDDALSHLIGVSMDPEGYPISLFTTNRWVTGETWYAAEDVRAMLPRFVIDQARPSWPVNRWISAMIRLFRPEIETLIRQRDETIRSWQQEHANVDVYEDRNLEITSQLPINVESHLDALRQTEDAPSAPAHSLRSRPPALSPC